MNSVRNEKARIRQETKRRSAGINPLPCFDERFENKCIPIPVTGCIIWLGHVGHSGHGQVFFKGKLERTHRVAWIKKHGYIPDGLSVLHKCDIPSCVNPDHLFLGDQLLNMQDMHSKGRACIGVKHHQAKLTEDDVRKIIVDTRGVTLIAKDFGVTAPTICAIKSGHTWKSVPRLTPNAAARGICRTIAEHYWTTLSAEAIEEMAESFVTDV